MQCQQQQGYGEHRQPLHIVVFRCSLFLLSQLYDQWRRFDWKRLNCYRERWLELSSHCTKCMETFVNV